MFDTDDELYKSGSHLHEGGPVFIGAPPLLSAYFLTTYGYRNMRVITRDYGTRVGDRRELQPPNSKLMVDCSVLHNHRAKPLLLVCITCTWFSIHTGLAIS